MTVDLPGQAARTIRANIKYLQVVLVDQTEDYNHETAVRNFNNYMLEDSNLEAAIRKLQDFFTDLRDDISIYQKLMAANRKLAADVSAVAAFLESERTLLDDLLDDIPLNNQPSLEVMENLAEAIERGNKPSRASLNRLPPDLNGETYIMKNLKQYLGWVISDIELLQEIVDSAADQGIFKKYRNLV